MFHLPKACLYYNIKLWFCLSLQASLGELGLKRLSSQKTPAEGEACWGSRCWGTVAPHQEPLGCFQHYWYLFPLQEKHLLLVGFIQTVLISFQGFSMITRVVCLHFFSIVNSSEPHVAHDAEWQSWCRWWALWSLCTGFMLFWVTGMTTRWACNCCPGKWQLPVFIAKCNLFNGFLVKLGFTLWKRLTLFCTAFYVVPVSAPKCLLE